MPDPLQLLRVLRARVRALFHRDGVADEIREELEFHVRMRAEDYERAGETRDEAARHARARVGNVTVLRDRGYDVRGGGFVETVVQDARYAMRQFARQPGFTLVAIGTLALGVGLSTALFSVIDAALLHPLPYPHPEQLVDLTINQPGRGGRRLLLAASRDDVRRIREGSRTIADVAMWDTAESAIVADDSPERLEGYEIDEGYLRLYGVSPALGRGFAASDMARGAAPVVLIGYDYWQRKYGGSRDVLGRTMHLDTGAATIVGVLPSSFMRHTGFWRPLTIDPARTSTRGSGAVVYARLRPGVDTRRASEELAALLPRPASTSSGPFVVLIPLIAQLTDRYQTTVKVLLGAVGLILLIGCVNVAGLLLARGATRRSELAIRASIGASRRRLLRQMVTESLVLSLAGGLCGVLLAYWSLDALVANVPISISRDSPPALNLGVLASSATLTLIVGLIFGLVPALRLSRAAGRGLQQSRSGSPLTRRSSSVLIAAEIALAIVLLAGAALMVRSFSRLIAVDLGFEPSAIVTLDTVTVDPHPAVVAEYYAALLDRVRALPGVAVAGAIDEMPLSFNGTVTVAAGAATAGVAIRNVLPGYFEAIGLPLKAGRLPTASDLNADAVVIGQAAAKSLFPGGSAVGHEITLGRFPQPLLVIGVVGDVRFWGPQLPAEPVVYRVFRSSNRDSAVPLRAFTLVIRPSAHAGSLATELHQAATSVGPRVLVGPIRSGSDWLQDTVVTPRRRAILLGLLGALGLLLSLVGVFGMTAYAVSRRTQEIGVRMAVGATPPDVLRMMLTDVAKPVGFGIAAGLVGAALATRTIKSFLFQTSATEPATLAIVAVTIAVAALLAAWIPSRRALRVDPVSALRAE